LAPPPSFQGVSLYCTNAVQKEGGGANGTP
jgi:hypothetical protein